MCEFKIDVKEVLDNLKKIKSRLNLNTKVCAVVKADAYGFGVKKMYDILKDRVDYFAVARLCEFLELQSFGNEKPCIILSPLYGDDLEVAISQGAEIIVSSFRNINEINSIAKAYQTRAKIHLKVDTGMNRFGFNNFHEFKKAVKLIKKQENIDVVGLCSHFYDALNKEVCNRQRTRFIFYKKVLNNFGFYPMCHLSSSKGVNQKLNLFDMVRVGFDLYHSNNHSFIAKVLEVKQIKKGDVVGYNAGFKAKDNMFIAICSVGYADGLFRGLKGAYVLVNGNKCKILGNICMDSIIVEVPKNAVKINDDVVIFGKSEEKLISVCDLSKFCDTIPYEIYTSISKRVKRVYLNADYHRKI